DWILVLDADEVIAEKDLLKIKKLLAVYEVTDEIGGYILIQRNYFKSREDLSYGYYDGLKVNAAGQSNESFISSEGDDYSQSKCTIGWMPTPIVRLFRNSGARFQGVVHEDISSSLKGKIINCNIPIHHFGKLDLKNRKAKWDLYEKLAERKAAQEKDYHAYFELGRQYLAGKKLTLAKEMFLKSISLNEKYWLNWFNLGSIYLIENVLDSAVDCLEKAKSINPQAVAVYANLGVAYVKKKEFTKAIDNFVQVLHFNPKDASVYKNLGLCFDEIGDKKKAYLALKKAVELNPEYGKTIKFS
ncbi:MAG: hypothetical protein KKD75_01390, partial [Nanoarchaeota archaeon]|nr:hypothetical protein [Nanoarchaeota archaeon]MBU1632171.1 hypothetical protein [Nanoarchaeota archaeon]